jgi:hypothetical protein
MRTVRPILQGGGGLPVPNALHHYDGMLFRSGRFQSLRHNPATARCMQEGRGKPNKLSHPTHAWRPRTRPFVCKTPSRTAWSDKGNSGCHRPAWS